jgi:hypothetical protein
MFVVGRRNLSSFAVCVFLLTVFAPVSRADTLVMPRVLVDLAHANGCNPISEFFESSPDLLNLINPPYVLGWIPALRDSAVFWCKKAEASDRPYRLMFAVPTGHGFKLADPKQLAGCPATIEYWNGPAGLSIEIRRNLKLRDFQYVKQPRQSGPAVMLASARVVVSDNGDGLVAIFYCHRGDWLVLQLD